MSSFRIWSTPPPLHVFHRWNLNIFHAWMLHWYLHEVMRNSKVEFHSKCGKKKATRPSYLYTYHIYPSNSEDHIALKVPMFVYWDFFFVNPGICVSLKAIPNVFFLIQVSSNAKTSGSRGMWNWTLKRRSNAIFIRQPERWKWEVHGTKTSEEVIFPHFPHKCILFQKKSRKSIYQIHFLFCGLNWMSLWILLKSMRVLSFYLTPGLPFLGPRVHSNPPPSRTLAAKVTPKCW